MKLAYVKSVMAALVVSALMVIPAFAANKKETIVPLAPAPNAQEHATEPAPAAVPPGAAAPVNVPDTSNIMFMQNLRKIGATIYYLGENLGLHGWFVVKDGQVQIMYTTPDQKALLIGALLSPEGANVSQQQVMVLANNNPDIQKVLKNSAAVTGQPPKPSTALQAETKPSPDAPLDSPSEKFFNALLKAANITFGKDTAPQLLMIMDVNCPHCHRAWKAMEGQVYADKLRVTMIPVGAFGVQSEMQAANWLSMKDPFDAWKKHVDGDETIFAKDKPSAERVAVIHANTTLIQKWGVDQTPYFLYRGKNDKIRLIVGEPRSIDEIMSDIK